MSWLYPRPSTMVEVEGSGPFEIDANKFTGTRIAEVDINQMFDAINFLLGEYYYDINGTVRNIGADTWPGIPNVICKKVSARPVGTMNKDHQGVQHVTDWEQGFYAPKARLTCSYGPDENTEDEEDKPEEISLAVQSLNYSCEILTVPMKVGSESGDPDKVRTVNRHIRLPTITYTVNFPRVLRPQWDVLNEANGTLNSVSIFGGAAGTVLFDGPAADREIKSMGRPFWKLVLKFIYNKHGWNNELNPDTLTWEPATSVEGGNPPYELYNHFNIFRPAA